MNKFKPASEISINSKKIGIGQPVYFIAEIGSNFDQDIERAKDLIYLAKDAGADAAKFQHYTADSLVSDFSFKKMSGKKSHQAHWKKSVYQTYKEASINQEWTADIERTCREAGLDFFTSPYSAELVDIVDPFVPAFKIGSGDITWPEIIEKMSSKGKPIMLATGASDMEDVMRAANTILNITSEIVLLQCNTNYTADRKNFSHLQLKVITKFQEIFPGLITGLSDHTIGHVSVLGAVALGAKVIEKHFTDSTKRIGPDHSFSMTPATWYEMVQRTRELEDALGDGQKRVEENELETIVVQRRSICSNKNLKSGHRILKGDLIALRPCPEDSIEPFEMNDVIGRVLKNNIEKGDNLKWNDLA